MGPMGPMGLMGPMGPMGPMRPIGPIGPPRNCVRVPRPERRIPMKLRITALLCALLLPVAALAAAGDVLPFQASEKTLPNGLKVIVVPTGFPNIVAMYIPVQTGSRN